MASLNFPPFSGKAEDWPQWLSLFEELLCTKEDGKTLSSRAKLAWLRLYGGSTINSISNVKSEEKKQNPDETGYDSIVETEQAATQKESEKIAAPAQEEREYESALVLINKTLKKERNPLTELMTFRAMKQLAAENVQSFTITSGNLWFQRPSGRGEEPSYLWHG